MKLDKFIKDNCCNLVRNECIGVWANAKFNDTNECWPLKKEDAVGCGFFERVVLPWATKLGCHEELVDEYSKIDFGVIKRTKAVRDKEAKKVKKPKKKAKKYVKSSTRLTV